MLPLAARARPPPPCVDPPRAGLQSLAAADPCSQRGIRFGLLSPPRSYATVAVSGYTLFGSAIDGDVLKDLTARFVATLVPRTVAHGIVYGVALSCEPTP